MGSLTIVINVSEARLHESYLLEVDGKVRSEHQTFVAALKAGFEIKQKFPHSADQGARGRRIARRLESCEQLLPTGQCEPPRELGIQRGTRLSRHPLAGVYVIGEEQNRPVETVRIAGCDNVAAFIFANKISQFSISISHCNHWPAGGKDAVKFAGKISPSTFGGSETQCTSGTEREYLRALRS